ncbi:MAG: hypothetical protein ACRDD7_17305 [Peptostreptococcaceae bacterium]
MSFLLLNLTVGAANIILLELTRDKDKDIVQRFKDLENIIESIPSQKIKDFMYKFIGWAVDNPLMSKMFMFILVSLPIINVILLVQYIFDLVRGKKH